MSSGDWIFVMSFSILPAVLISGWRFRAILPSSRPFVYMTWLALLNDGLNNILTYPGRANAWNNNLYILLEWILLAWQMRIWSGPGKHIIRYQIITWVIIAVWLVDMLFLGNINRFSGIFRVCYSFMVVVLAIDRMNHVITGNRTHLFTNAVFLVSYGLIVFFSYRLLIEILLVLHVHQTPHFGFVLFWVMAFINVFCNLLFSIAALCLPEKKRFILPC